MALRVVGLLLLIITVASAVTIRGRTHALYVDAPQVGANTFATAYWENVPAVADSQVSQQFSTNNYGTDAAMDVQSRTNKHKRSFARFDLSSVVPPGNEVLKAELNLCATAVPGSTRTYEVHKVEAAWTEATITWNSQPAVAGASSDSISTPATAGCYTWPLMKSDVEGWVVGFANDGWRVKDSIEDGSNNNTTFRSREDTAVPSEQPNLFVVYRPCTDLTAPGAPLSLTGTGGDGQVALNWADNSELDLAGYNVYRSTSPVAPTPRSTLRSWPPATTPTPASPTAPPTTTSSQRWTSAPT